MNRNQVKGAVKDTVGKAQAAVGRATDNGSQVSKGMAKQAEGKAQKSAGNVQAVAQGEATTGGTTRRSRRSV